MLVRLSTFAVMACVLIAGACAESISFQRNPSLVSKGHGAPATSERATVSHAIAGDLGRGFSGAEQHSPSRALGREFYGDGEPRGSLVPSVTRPLNFGFYRSSSTPLVGMDAFTNLVLRNLLERKPKGPRRRRELAEGNSR